MRAALLALGLLGCDDGASGDAAAADAAPGDAAAADAAPGDAAPADAAPADAAPADAAPADAAPDAHVEPARGAPCEEADVAARRPVRPAPTCFCRVPAQCPTIEDALGRLPPGDAAATVCLAAGDHAAPRHIPGSVVLQGAGADATRLLAGGCGGADDVGTRLAIGATIRFADLALVPSEGGGACGRGILDARTDGRLELSGVRVSGFATAVATDFARPAAAATTLVVEASVFAGNGAPPVAGRRPQVADLANRGAILWTRGDVEITDSLVYGSGWGRPLATDGAAAVGLTRTCVRDNAAGASVRGGLGGAVPTVLEVAASVFRGHVDVREAADGSEVPNAALEAVNATAGVRGSAFLDNRLAVFAGDGRLELESDNVLAVDAGRLGAETLGIASRCADVTVRAGGLRLSGTSLAGLLASGMVSREPARPCPQPPLLDVRGADLCPAAGAAIAVGQGRALIVMNGFCPTTDFGVLSWGGQVVLAGGNTFAPDIPEALHVEADDVASLPGFGAEVLVGAASRPDAAVRAGLSGAGAEAVRACDADCAAALAAAWQLDPAALQAPGLAGDVLPVTQASDFRATALFEAALAGAAGAP